MVTWWMALSGAFLAVAGVYGLWVGVRLGVHQRLPLVLDRISLDRIPDRAARRHGDRPLFTTDEPCRWTVPAIRHRYPDPTAWSALRIRETAGYVAGVLRRRCGVGYPDRVALLKRNHLDIHVLLAGIVRAGGIACPINDRFDAGRLEAYLLNLGSRVLVSDRESLERLLQEGAGLGPVTQVVLADARCGEEGGDAGELEARMAAVHPQVEVLWLEEALADIGEEPRPEPRGKEEPLYLVHSSGTTGFPKAVILGNGRQSHAVRGWLCYVHLSRTRDRGYLAVPNNHQAVILSFNSLLLLGLPVHWTRGYHRDDFDPERVVRELAEGRFTGFFGFPIVYTKLKEVAPAERGLRRMRFWASTADASHEAIVTRFTAVGGFFRSLGWPLKGSVFLDAQGSSEVGTPSVIRYVTPFTKRFERRIGRPGSTPFGPRIRITEPGSWKPVARGEVGRLEVKGRTVFAGYWNHHALTLDAARDGWFFTGDVARRGADGHLVQLDREVDVIRTRHGAVYSLPIEEALHRHPAVFDICVYGARTSDGYQVPAAAVALRDGFAASPERLREELNARLGKEEQLQSVEILRWRDFPIGVTGKTLKRAFRLRTETNQPLEEPNRPITASGA
jgi:long-chain acyl-CoA synthetase